MTLESEMHYDIFETELGWVAVVMNNRGVLRMSLPEPVIERAYDHVRPEIEHAELDPDAATGVRERVQAYCSGADVDLSEVPVDMTLMSPFFRRAREACRSIPSGETRTYAWLAEQAGSPRAARGAGQAMAKNPVALLVPCHSCLPAAAGKTVQLCRGLACWTLSLKSHAFIEDDAY